MKGVDLSQVGTALKWGPIEIRTLKLVFMRVLVDVSERNRLWS